MNLFAVLCDLLADLAALIWPVECAGCGLADRACCVRCRAELVRAALAAGRMPDFDVDHESSNRSGTNLDLADGPARFVGGVHEGVLRDLLVAFKHAGRTSLAPILGEVLAVPLARAIQLAQGPDPPLIVPIPSRPERVRERGFHHVEVLTRAAMRLHGRAATVIAAPGRAVTRATPRRETMRMPGRPVAEPRLPGGAAMRAPERGCDELAPTLLRALRTLPGRTGQVGLRAGQRQINAARITIRRRARAVIWGREVILVDDVRTTGETLAAAAMLLTNAGSIVVATVTLAHAQRHAPKK